MLGADDTIITIGRREFILRRPLKACLRLVRRWPNPTQAVVELSELRLSALAFVISECSDQRISPAELFDAVRGPGLAPLASTLTTHVLELLGDGMEEGKERNQATPTQIPQVTLETFYRDLFEVGTGHIGWTAEATWNASPSEIMHAAKGRGDLLVSILKSVFCSSDDEDKPKQTGPDNSPLDRDGLASLRGMGHAFR